MRVLSSLLGLVALGKTLGVRAVTIYTTFTTDSDGQPLQPTNTDTATGPAYSGYTAYNLTTLTPPDLPSPMPDLVFGAQLYASGATGLSIPHNGSFLGWSVELSVVNQFIGRNSTRINPAFLNYVTNLKARAGQGIHIRVGGNTQELSGLYYTPFSDSYEVINKTTIDTTTAPTGTTQVNIYIDLLYMLHNVTQLTSSQWYLGLPMGYPVNVTGIVEMMKIYEEVLGDDLLALQLGNEPDLFGVGDRERPFAYPISSYFDEYTNITQALLADPDIKRQKSILSPSICCVYSVANWSIADVLDAGLLTEFGSSISTLAVQNYPAANCDDGEVATDLFPTFLRHDNKVVDYLNTEILAYGTAAQAAVANNLPLIMFETNSASCAGFPGLSDSFGASLWAIDWAMQLGYMNFSEVLFHFGGQDSSYNAFTPAPSNWSSIYQWTTGAIYYSMLVVAEAIGASNASQIIDLNLNGSPYTPGYAIYENGVPQRVLMINYMDDLGAGTASYTAYIHVGGQSTGDADTTPATVQVRYLAAPSVSEKFNITWAGQTMGGQFESDGILRGDLNTVTVTCQTGAGCPITIPAPGAALVFMTTQAEDESLNSALTATFPTSYYPQGAGPTIGQAVLATSNGRGGPGELNNTIGSTSHGDEPNAATRASVVLGSLISVALGALVVLKMASGL